MDKGICLLSQVPGRRKPADASEMITQLVFGDTFEVLEDLGKWLHIKQSLDQGSIVLLGPIAGSVTGESFNLLSEE